jgi:hypothetical protein
MKETPPHRGASGRSRVARADFVKVNPPKKGCESKENIKERFQPPDGQKGCARAEAVMTSKPLARRHDQKVCQRDQEMPLAGNIHRNLFRKP